MTQPKLDPELQDLVVCPLCKTSLHWATSKCECDSCGLDFPRSSSGVWGFIVQPPTFVRDEQYEAWSRSQAEYEKWDRTLRSFDSYEEHISGLEEVSEIYSQEFSLSGMVLDVGGHQGRLRHFLPAGVTYLSLDPYADVFDNLDRQPNLLRAYLCLKEPCNFIQAHAERVPLKAGSFNYVHMRSVLDHFFDPYVALLEARRVLRSDGGLLIGVHVLGGRSSIASGSSAAMLISRLRKRIRDEGIGSLFMAASRMISRAGSRGVHLWRPNFDRLLDLLQLAHFDVEKVHWQKPPNDHVVYILARKRNTAAFDS